MHVGWSGNQRYVTERLPEGAGVHRGTLGGGELLLPGEIVLGPGQEYQAPTVYYAWSGEGLDGIAGAFHAMLRDRAAHPARPRPLLVNTWEAVYFDHDVTRLLSLIDQAASVGAERVVLDDGWFEGRRDDSNGLGDWFVDKDVWPEGLWPIVNRARSHGMQFGLWFEPEMVNLGSRIIGEHPEWLLAPTRGAGPAIRNQHVLNIAHPAAWDYVFGRIDELVGEYSIDYIKWDHNRELHEAARRDANDRPGVNAQTRALYRMLDALKSRHPSLEIESCASGGGRIDLGILARTDRVWASDCNDPVERQQIQRWTAQLIPPELIGAHVASARSHTTNRTTSLSFRLITSLFGHAGIEEDLTRAERGRAGGLPGLGRPVQARPRPHPFRPAGSRRPVRRHVPVSRRRRARPLTSAVRLGLPGDLRTGPARTGTLSRPAPRPGTTGSPCPPKRVFPAAARASTGMAGRRSRRVPRRFRSPADRGRPAHADPGPGTGPAARAARRSRDPAEPAEPAEPQERSSRA